MRINNRRIILLLLAVIILGTLSLLSGCGTKKTTTASESATTVNIATVAKRNIYGSSSYSNRLKANIEVEVLPKTSERIISINVKEGQEVGAGQNLMTLDSSSLKASINKAEAQLASAKAALTNNDINLEAANKNYERQKSLYEQGAVSQKEVENAENEYELLKSGSAEASVAEAQASLQENQDQVGYCNITAPVSGVVGRIDVSVGDFVTTSKTVAVISNPQKMLVEISVSESDIGKIKLNGQVNVYVDSVSKNAITGTVTSIASVLDSNSDMYTVTVTIDNAAGILKSGMYAEVAIDTSSVQNALCIPASAVIPTNGVQIVYTVNDKNRVKRVEVKTGINDDKYVQILSGLKAGDKVVTLGNTLISDGSLVIPKSKEGK